MTLIFSHLPIISISTIVTRKLIILLPTGSSQLIGGRRAVSSHPIQAAWDAPTQVCKRLEGDELHFIRYRRKKTHYIRSFAMSRKTHTLAGSGKEKTLAPPRPSASVILLSPENKVLLLHRVKTSSAFPSAHVFPGGNLSQFHDGTLPGTDDPKFHEDSLPYKLCAIRETFEESGILIAREEGGDGNPLNVPSSDRDKARKAIYKKQARFVEWLADVGGVPDTENLLPFTRWITPPNQLRRFTTQMYIYMLPISTSDDPAISAAQSEAIIPTPDGGVEITAARFDDASTWLEKQHRGEIVLFPPQCFLLHIISQFLVGPPGGSPDPSLVMEHYRSQREKLRGFLSTVPTADSSEALKHPTSQIPWGEKVISPNFLGIRKSDKRSILGLANPGPELRGSNRAGDFERVVLVRFEKGIAKEVEVRDREKVLAEDKQLERETKEAKL